MQSLTRLTFWRMTVPAIALVMAALGMAHDASAFSQDYCYTNVDTSHYCGHGNYNSIIYNRSTAVSYTGNNCVYMITAAGNIRGNGAVPCDTDYNFEARECVSSDTPMSEGRTFVRYSTDYLAAVVNNLTYDSGCAV